jgi:hypothetical protein
MAKGWDRASLDRNVRPDKIERNVSQQDLLIPTLGSGGKLELLLISAACGLMLAFLWVWTTLLVLTILGHGVGRWFYPLVFGAALVGAVAIFSFATRDFERNRRWAEEI